MNGTFLISYVKKNKFFHSPKTCLSHGKTIALLGLLIPYRRRSPNHWPIVVQKSCDFRFRLFLLNKRNALQNTPTTCNTHRLYTIQTAPKFYFIDYLTINSIIYRISLCGETVPKCDLFLVWFFCVFCCYFVLFFFFLGGAWGLVNIILE